MPRALITLTSLLLAGAVVGAAPAHAAKPCKACRDTTPPQVKISAPAAGSGVAGTTTVSGSASDNVGIASVAVSVDAGAWQLASGTTAWSWSWNTATLANGAHTVAARAVDGSGNATTVTESVNVSNAVADTTAPSVSITYPSAGATLSGTVSIAGAASDNVAVSAVAIAVDGGAWQPATGTTSWTASWDSTTVADGSHTIAVRATDSSGNTATSSVTVTTSNTPVSPPPSTSAPNTQGTWVSPEGVTIDVNSAGSWTIAQIYSILQANALDLDKVGPHLTIEVQDQYTSQTQTNATYYAGKYTNVASTMWLQGVNSGFASRPDDTLTHEYGHAWSMYWYYTAHQANWSSFENARWTMPDGSLTLATDSRTNTSYIWQVGEIVADDYRLLFGSGLAVSERPTHLNNQIPDPRNVPGLASFLLNGWRTAS